jgi:hypothetical protein
LKNLSDELERKKQAIANYKTKTAQAQSDKIELMRDLATYEANFSDNDGCRSSFLRLHKFMQDVKNKMDKIGTNQISE